ncbi:MAG: ATP-binding protein, partial [Paracoccaceae bacterium]
LVILATTSVMMLFVAFLFLRNQLRPVLRLAKAAEAFGKGRMIPLRISGASEVRAAGAAFLDMRARIERQIESRTLMLSGVSHDLRTPLTRLKLGLAMLDGPERAELERDVDDMRRMIDGFLDFARAEATEEEAEAVDPVELAVRVIDDMRKVKPGASLFQVEGQGMATLRRSAVERALGNLLSNALSYGQNATLSLHILERSVRYTVEDDGPGIAEELREEAIKPFVRLVPGRNQDNAPGVGLGLAICADIARSHGGSLRLGRSERMGGLKAELLLAR